MPEIVGRLRPPRITGAAPATPARGELYYDADDDTLYWWNGSVWISASGGTSPTTNLPLYTTATLPISAASGTLAILNLSIAGTAWRYLIRFNTGLSAWDVIGTPGVPHTAASVPTSIPSGTGWRASNLSITLPLAGSWKLQGQADVSYSAVESTGGVGISGQDVVGTASPTMSVGTQGQGTANTRTQCATQISRATIAIGTNDVISLRANTAGATTVITFYRAAIYAEPVYLIGVV
jgi:hypothetical protein